MPERQQLFNGRDLDGWEHVGPGSFSVEDGALVSHGGMGLLWYTGETFGDVQLGVRYRLGRREDNSGVFIRIADRPPDPWFAVHHGYEVQILDTAPDAYHRTGALYSLAPAATVPQLPLDAWNELRIELRGSLVVVTLNGVEATRFDSNGPVPERSKEWEPERGPRPLRGYLGLQNHDDASIVRFSAVWVETLPV
jgi:hypothetical protein